LTQSDRQQPRHPARAGLFASALLRSADPPRRRKSGGCAARHPAGTDPEATHDQAARV